MPATSKLSDAALREHLSNGLPQAQIAALCGVTHQAVSKRVKVFETRAAAKAPLHVVRAAASMWDTRTAAEENYQRCLTLLDECENAGERVRALAEIRQHLQFGMQVIETLYTVQETKDFMAEVLNVIGQIDKNARDTILRKLSENHTLRAAFLPHH